MSVRPRAVVEQADDARRRALLTGHPELAGCAARDGTIAPDSIAEQAAAGLDRLSKAEYARFAAPNAAYRPKFGIPFIVCVKRQGAPLYWRRSRPGSPRRWRPSGRLTGRK